MLNSTARCDRRKAATSYTSWRRMCRSSARGCTVIPGAPAATQTRTASTTDRNVPPRELRSVATLLTLTLSLTKLHFHGVRNLVRPAVNLLLVLAFNHHAEQRLGARIPDEQAALPVQALFHAIHHLSDRRY